MNQPHLARNDCVTAARHVAGARSQAKRRAGAGAGAEQAQAQAQAQEKAKDASASGKLCAGRRLIPVRLRAWRPRGELVGYLAGKLAGVPAD